jgi:outer membrane murein-binding lipoprotein Lpp
MTRLAIFAAAAATGFALAGCDSPAENEVEQTAEAIDESYEAEADLVESMEAGGPSEEAAEAEADALREQGEETKDRLEDDADAMDALPQ